MANELDILIKIQADLRKLQQTHERLIDLTDQQAETGKVTAANTRKTNEWLQSFKTGIAIDAVQQLRRGLVQVRDIMVDLVNTGLEFNQNQETARLGIAAIIRTMNPQEVGNFNRAMEISGALLEELKVKAKESSASFQDLVALFQATAAPASAAGLSLREQLDLAILLANAISGIGLKGPQLIQEARALISGDITTAASLATALNIGPTDIANAKEQGRLMEFITERLIGFSEAAEPAAGSMALLKSNLQDMKEILMGDAMGPFFREMKTSLEGISEIITAPDFQQGIKDIGLLMGLALKLANKGVESGIWWKMPADAIEAMSLGKGPTGPLGQALVSRMWRPVMNALRNRFYPDEEAANPDDLDLAPEVQAVIDKAKLQAELRSKLETQFGHVDLERGELQLDSAINPEKRLKNLSEEVFLLMERRNILMDVNRSGDAFSVLETRQKVLDIDREIFAIKEEQVKVAKELAELERDTFTGMMGEGLTELSDQWGDLRTNIVDVSLGSIQAGVNGVSDAIMGMIDGTATWGEVFAQVARNIIASLIQIVVQWIANMTLIAALKRAFKAEETTAATTSAAAWAPAAYLANTASFGAAGVAALAGTIAGMASTTAVAATLSASTAGFQTGGYTGDGDPSEIAGFVHKREVVFDAPAVARIGREPLEALRTGRSAGVVNPSVNVSPAGVKFLVVNGRQDAIRAMKEDPEFRQVFIDLYRETMLETTGRAG